MYTFAEDIAASGGYLILLAGDKVYADKTSVVGSIGVVSSKLNLKGVGEMTGVDSRSYTSDEYPVIKVGKHCPTYRTL